MAATASTKKPMYAGTDAAVAVKASWLMPAGMRETMPAKMRSETPLPMPNSVMSSPIHMRSIEPAATRNTFTANSNGDKAPMMPWLSKSERNATPWSMASGMVMVRDRAMNFVRPASPSSWYMRFTAGKMTVPSCMMIEAVM